MRIQALFAVFFLLAGTLGAVAADPAGRYGVEGTSPGDGSKYTGDVVVTKTGDTYRVVWTIGDTKYYGTAIGDENFLAVSYKSGSSTGLALYGEKKDNWAGVWTYAGGKTIGTEKWIRK